MEKKIKSFFSLCGLSTESFLAIWPSQYKFLIYEFLIKKYVFRKIQISKISGWFSKSGFYEVHTFTE